VLSDDAVVFLLDVDDTLLDNDRFGADLGARLEQAFGAEQRDRYWAIFSALRDEWSYADYLGALQRFRFECDDEAELSRIASFMLDYPFADRLYPHALDAVAHLRTLGLPVVLSDGDVVFQPRKIERSGISAAVQGRVIIALHKERSLDVMRRRFPARRYVMVDDKVHVLAAMKRVLGRALTTVFVHQGHYAAEAIAQGTSQASMMAAGPPPDLEIECIADLLDRDLLYFLAASPAGVEAASQE
jgi:FMN phosphatase YigB (HAD superfamily)